MGIASGDWLGTYFQICGAPALDRSSAYTMFGKDVWTYITLPITRGLPSWPRRVPVENDQTGRSSATFEVVICLSGLNRCRLSSRPVMSHSPAGAFRAHAPDRACWALADNATATAVALSASAQQ